MVGQISEIRAINQQLSDPVFKSAKEVAGWMGAMQAQDYSMAKWAFGIRLPEVTENTINKEIDSGNLIRMHLLRPTWHFVSSDDVHWMLKLSASHIKSSLKFRDKQLGLSDTILGKCNSAIEKVLGNGRHLTREVLFSELEGSKLNVSSEQTSHIFAHAEMEGIICSGRQVAGKPTYTLLGEWVKEDKMKLTRDEALKELALRYFRSHGPATIQDFAWWSGLSLNEARLAVEFNKSFLISETLENKTWWFSDSLNTTNRRLTEAYLLPAYDEFIISYSDRSMLLPQNNQKKAISGNGIFYPAILVNGIITGTWKRLIKKEKVIISMKFFKSETDLPATIFAKAIGKYSQFLDKETELDWH